MRTPGRGRRLARIAAILLAAAGCGVSDPDGADARPGSPLVRDPGGNSRVGELRRQAHDAIRRGDLDVGRRRLETVLDLMPEDREALFLLGAIALDEAARREIDRPDESRERLTRAIEKLRRLWERYPDLRPEERERLADALFLDARRLVEAGQPDAALARLQEADRAGFADPEALTEGGVFAPLRDRPGFAALVRRLTGRAEARARDAAREALGKHPAIPFDFALPDVDGKVISLAQVRGRAVTVVDVWGTWCPPCRLEVPRLVALHKAYRDRGLAVVGVNFENTDTPAPAAALVRQAVAELNIPYPCLLGDAAMGRSIPGFGTFPTLLFLDHDGRIRAQLSGARPYRELEAIAVALLAEASRAPPRTR